TVCRDGVEALGMLKGNPDRALKKPFVVILDLNMPRMTGLEFLQVVREHRSLRDLVIFVLSTSASPSDLETAYRFSVAGYLVKSDDSNQYQNFVNMLADYWSLVTFPEPKRVTRPPLP
ncbi:MAG: response regulator, partial [Myxococcales bacterium]|nr:response regulator [Myxococcales bacterium]